MAAAAVSRRRLSVGSGSNCGGQKSPCESHMCHGYDAEFLEEPDKKYVCPICLAVLRDSIQTCCGHRFCNPCIMGVLGNSNRARCPVDNAWIRRKEDLFEDIAIQREILSLQVRCSEFGDGCSWTGELRQLTDHSKSCKLRKVSCKFGCGLEVTMEEATVHYSDCPRRLVPCSHCEINIVISEVMKHQLLTCQKFPVNCKLCGTPGIIREQLDTHVENECANAMVTCKFSPTGCNFQDLRKWIDNHYATSSEIHMSLLLTHVVRLEEELKEERAVTKRLKSELKATDSTLSELQQQMQEQSQKLNTMDHRIISGQLYWKIVMPEERGCKIYSPPFYTGWPGFKLQMCLELHGYQERGISYASIFVLLRKGDFDEQLSFPFNAVCYAHVYEQNEMSNVPTMSTDSNSAIIQCRNVPRCNNDSLSPSRFQRGRLKFMATSKLLSPRFIKNGMMYIDIKIAMSP